MSESSSAKKRTQKASGAVRPATGSAVAPLSLEALARDTQIAVEQLRMPAGYKQDGTLATLAELLDPEVATLELAELTPEQRQSVIVKRLEQRPTLDLMMIGAGHINQARALAEVQANTEIGRTLMEIEQRSINYLLNKARKK